VVIFYRGIGIGAVTAGMYTSRGTEGILPSLVLIIPFAVMSGIILIMACRESMRLSATILKVTSHPTGSAVDYKLFVNKYILMAALLLIASLFDALLTYLFAGFLQ
jgi:hypothetical protein